MINYIIMGFNIINTQVDILKKNIKMETLFSLDAKIIGRTRDRGKEWVIFVMQKLY